MKSFILLFLSLIAPFTSYANTTYNVMATSDYVWRGITQTAHKAAIQGGMDYELPVSGLSLGVWTSNVEVGSEADLYTKYIYKISDAYSLGVGGTFYYYTKNNNTNTGEANLYFNAPLASVTANYTENYFGTETSSFYFEASQPFKIDAEKNVSLVPVVGYVTFDDKEKSQAKNYLNYRVELLKEYEQFNFRLFYANTNRKIYSAGSEVNVDDESIGVSVFKNF